MQKIINGFPQFFDYTYLKSIYSGTLATQVQKTHTDINTLTGCIGDKINLKESNIHLLTIIRDGAALIEDEGFELIAENLIRVTPGLLQDEVIELKLFTGIDGSVTSIQSIPPATPDVGYPQTVQEATVWTDNSQSSVNAYAPTVYAGRTRIKTHFDLVGRIDIYVNSRRIGKNAGLWSQIDNNTIDLNDDYSTSNMLVEIVKQVVGN